MRAPRKIALAALAAAGMLVIPLTATAGGDRPSKVETATATFDYTKNLQPLGYSPRMVPLDNTSGASGVFNSDLAFEGEDGRSRHLWRIQAGSTSLSPTPPTEIVNWTECASNTNTVGNQGDVIVWGDLVFRSWNSGTPAPPGRVGLNIPVTDPARFTTPGRVLRGLANVPRAGRSDHWAARARPGGRAHHRHQRSGEPGRDRFRRYALRVAYRDARARPREQPAAGSTATRRPTRRSECLVVERRRRGSAPASTSSRSRWTIRRPLRT